MKNTLNDLRVIASLLFDAGIAFLALVLLIGSVFYLSGCAAEQIWMRADTDAATIAADRADCYRTVAEQVPEHAAALREVAALVASGGNPAGAAAANFALHQAGVKNRVIVCMFNKGYRFNL